MNDTPMAEQDLRGKTSVLDTRWYRSCEWFLNCCVKIILEKVEIKMLKDGKRGQIGNIGNCRNRLPGG
jgi:hypothetical protein